MEKEIKIVVDEPLRWNELSDEDKKTFMRMNSCTYGLDTGDKKPHEKYEAQLVKEYYRVSDNWEALRKMIQDTITALIENAKDPNDNDIAMICGTFGRVLNMMEELENEKSPDTFMRGGLPQKTDFTEEEIEAAKNAFIDYDGILLPKSVLGDNYENI